MAAVRVAPPVPAVRRPGGWVVPRPPASGSAPAPGRPIYPLPPRGRPAPACEHLEGFMSAKRHAAGPRLSVEALEDRSVPAFGAAGLGLSVAVGDVDPGGLGNEFVIGAGPGTVPRSEERRVGKEGRAWGWEAEARA